MSSATPSRGEIWTAHLGEPPVLHWVVVVSLNPRNHRAGVRSILIVPFSSKLYEGPTTMTLDPQETGLPNRSSLRAHFIQPVTKSRLVERVPKELSGARMQELCFAIRRSFDPDTLSDKSIA